MRQFYSNDRARSPECARRARRRLGQRAAARRESSTDRRFRSTAIRRGRRPIATAPVIRSSAPSYFRLLGVPVLQGRTFTDADATNAPQVAIVDEAFVRRYLKGRTPIGTRLSVNAMVQPPQAVLREIVGVVKHIKERPDEPEAEPQLYVPIAQNTWWRRLR